jgi:hypothetical protein
LFDGACGFGFGWWADHIYEKGRATGSSESDLFLAVGLGLAVSTFIVISLIRQAFRWARGRRQETQASRVAKAIALTFGSGSLAGAVAFANGSRPWQLATITLIGTCGILLFTALPFVALVSATGDTLVSPFGRAASGVQNESGERQRQADAHADGKVVPPTTADQPEGQGRRR